jgi:hypothetical protein
MKKSIIVAAICTFAIGCALGGIASAQQQLPAAANQSPTIKRIPLQKYDVPGAPLETVVAIAEITPNVNIGRHNHPGTEGGYVLEGDIVMMMASNRSR